MPFKKSAARSSATASLIRTPRRPRVKRSPRLWKLISSSARDTDRLGRAIGRGLRGGEILALVGPLGAGKTALVRGIALGLGAAPASVSSPTFVLIHEYRGRLPLVHVDLYRVGSHVELESTGLVDYFNGMTIAVIEWADRGRAFLPEDRLEIELRHMSIGSRTIRLAASGPTSEALLLQTRTELGRSTRTRSAPKQASSS